MKVFTNMCKIVGVPVDSSLAEKTPRSMELLPSLKNKLLDILLDDLNVGAIPAYARTSLELELRMSEEPAERAVLQKVRLCNLFRQYTAKISQPTCSDLKSVLSDATVADVDWLRIVLNGGRINGEVRSGVVAKLAFLVDRDLIGTPLKQKIAEFVSDSPRSPSMSPGKFYVLNGWLVGRILLQKRAVGSIVPHNPMYLWRWVHGISGIRSH